MSCKKYSKIKFMTYAQTNSILNEYDGRGKDGHDYHDQIDSIREQYWSLVEKRLQSYIKKEESNVISKQRRNWSIENIPF